MVPQRVGSKDEKAMVRERRYVCRLTPFDFTGALRDYQQLRLRYPDLHVSSDFSHVKCMWPDSSALTQPTFETLVSPAAFFCGIYAPPPPRAQRDFFLLTTY